MEPEANASRGAVPSALAGRGERARVGVVADTRESRCRMRAAEWAARRGFPLVDTGDERHAMLLAFTEERLELRLAERGGPKPLFVDFVNGPLGYARRVNRFGLLFKAVGFRTGRPVVLDATAGLGHDAFRLAYHGCAVTAVERSPILHALVEDGLARAEGVSEIHEQLGGRLRLVHADAREVLRTLTPDIAPDVVYLDPMFPPKKKSVLAKVEMRILRQLVGDDPDAGELFALAMAVARKRVVVKRHRHAEVLAANPSHSHGDKTTRYDVYMIAGHREDSTTVDRS